MLLGGCGGGSGGGSGGGGLSGHQTIRATAISTYQSVAALAVYPLTAMQTSAPPGSNITAVPIAAKGAVTSSSLTLVHHTGLYSSGPKPTASGATYTYYTTAAGTTSAGTMSLDSSSSSFDYSTYPSKVDVAIDVTAGYLPCKGQAVISYANSSGAAEMLGTLFLTGNQERVTFDLTLSSDHQISGNVQIVQNGMTFQASQISGPLVGDQSLQFTSSPSNFAGTGTFDLLSPTITLSFTNPSGASASIDSSHHLVIHYGNSVGGGSGSSSDEDDIVSPIIELLLDSGSDDPDDNGDTSSDGSTGDTSGDNSGDGGCDSVKSKSSTAAAKRK